MPEYLTRSMQAGRWVICAKVTLNQTIPCLGLWACGMGGAVRVKCFAGSERESAPKRVPPFLCLSGVEVAQADINDPQSIALAVKDAHTIFAYTASVWASPEVAYQTEYTQGKTIADAAVAAGANYLIWSSCSSVKKISGGKLTNVYLFDVKAGVEASSALSPPHSPSWGWGIWNRQHHRPDTLLPLINPASDSGKFIGTTLATQDKYVGKIFLSAVRLYSLKEIVEIASKVCRKEVRLSDSVAASATLALHNILVSFRGPT
ncbi:hypothetical protein EV426DRAFT_644155 [Tirmania nivea]|nr:hypothetical protein EV426DRAFT_644155 [Tirmania nivea]